MTQLTETTSTQPRTILASTGRVLLRALIRSLRARQTRKGLEAYRGNPHLARDIGVPAAPSQITAKLPASTKPLW
ncbi:hypothetical protein [Phaeobacter sp. J2-8]|uniref:hypothetical protein n=1 Tax=Phaeobacter sp. J2-8 TaxID=2931394 RepID=UPI001FD62127|nr:hypothetical protein [Phaeobacter sp. J2-8]MCJ7873663.1 hypothetical protein [Phaeobacter sp. J2-8]